MSNIITVITVVENDSGLFDLMIRSVRKFTPGAVKFVVCNNGKRDPVLDKYREDDDITIIEHQPELSGGSSRHGEALNVALSHVDTDIAAIIESDCVVVSPMWRKGIGCGNKLMAAKKGECGYDYYYAAFMKFYPVVMKEIDLRPGPPRANNKSYQPHEDVAWQIGKRIKPEQVKLLECVDCKTGKGKILNSTFQSEEYWVDGTPIVVHFGRGSNLAGKANRKGFDSHDIQMQKFKDEMEKILRK